MDRNVRGHKITTENKERMLELQKKNEELEEHLDESYKILDSMKL